jgi:transcriptional regulator with XRE-family HTH domain
LNSGNLTFQEYLIREMQQRKMSARAFAEFIGVSHTLINKLTDTRKPVEPTLDFLSKLAKATSVDVIYLIEVAYPGLIEPEREISPQILSIAQKIEKLPVGLQDAIAHLINESLGEKSDASADD